jgi:endoglucanase
MINKSTHTTLTLSGSTLRWLAIALQAAALCGCGDSSPDKMDDDTTNPDGSDPGATPGKGDPSTNPNTTPTAPPSTTGNPPPTPPAGPTPVELHGALKVMGNRIVDKNGAPTQLRGMSFFWSQWSGSFYNASVVKTLARDWHASLVRIAMGVEKEGYLEHPADEKARVKTIVDAATAEGIYVIIDWHDHNANSHTQQSKAFFTEMAQTYGKQPNVIFEVFNEPDNLPAPGDTWPQVKAYAEEVIGAIRGAGSDNLVIVGTPTWSQDVDIAANDRINKFQNIAYTLHFYAASHKQSLRDKAKVALDKGLALFTTEWGTCPASGDGALDLGESQTWINFLTDNGISFANWSLFDKPEAASALVPGASPEGGWADSELTESGKFVKAKILEGK